MPTINNFELLELNSFVNKRLHNFRFDLEHKGLHWEGYIAEQRRQNTNRSGS